MHKHRTGLIDPIYIDVTLDTGVPKYELANGDLVARDSDNSDALVAPADFTWTTDKATTQAAFAAAFRGLCVSRSSVASKDYRQLRVKVCQDGNVEFDCVSGTYVDGDYLGCAKGSGSNLIDTLEAVADKDLAVAVCVKNSGASATKVLARLINTIPKK